MSRPLAVITGGTRGIGRAIVEHFLAEGFDVVTCARDAQALAALQSQFPEQVFVKSTDMSQCADVEAFAQFVLALDRPIAVLVNNTGVFLPGQIHNEPDGTLELQIDTNLYSVYHLTRALLPPMLAAKQGHIFVMCSVASITPYAHGGSYCISKFALYGLTKVLREELKPHGIKVTALLPGATLTDSWAGVDVPPERLMKPEDVAQSLWAAYTLSKSAVIEEILLRPQLGDL